MTIEGILRSFSIWSVVAPFLAGIFLLKKLSFNFKIITGIVALSTISQLVDLFFKDGEPIKNITYNLYTPLEFVLFYFIFDKYIQRKTERSLFKISSVFYLFVSLFLIYKYGVSARFLNEWVCVNNLIYTAWILIIFYNQYSLTGSSNLNFTTPVFWVFTGLLLYAPCSSVIFSSWHYLKDHDNPSSNNLWIIHDAVNIVMYAFFAIGIYKDYATNSNKSIQIISSPGLI